VIAGNTSRHFAPTQAGEEFYRHAASLVRAADEAESLVRQRVKEPFGLVRFTAAIGTAQFALREILMNFIREYPRIQLVEYVTSRQIDLLAEKQGGSPKTPQDLKHFPSLFLSRANTTPAWRLRPQAKTRRRQSEVTLPLTPRMVSNDPSTLKQAAVNGMGIALGI
jgi:DNA-binding transcriptional LysR family regulator